MIELLAQPLVINIQWFWRVHWMCVYSDKELIRDNWGRVRQRPLLLCGTTDRCGWHNLPIYVQHTHTAQCVGNESESNEPFSSASRCSESWIYNQPVKCAYIEPSDHIHCIHYCQSVYIYSMQLHFYAKWLTSDAGNTVQISHLRGSHRDWAQQYKMTKLPSNWQECFWKRRLSA